MSNPRTKSARRTQPKLRGDSHPTHSGLINLLEDAIRRIEAGDVADGATLAVIGAQKYATSDEAGDSRRTERLIALWHYEADDDTGGCSIHEYLPDLFRLATAVLSPGGDEDMTAEQMERADRDAQIISDRVMLALVEAGHYERALAFVEDLADRRRRCDVRYGAPRAIPFGRREWELMLKEQGSLDEYGCIRPMGGVQ